MVELLVGLRLLDVSRLQYGFDQRVCLDLHLAGDI